MNTHNKLCYIKIELKYLLSIKKINYYNLFYNKNH